MGIEGVRQAQLTSAKERVLQSTHERDAENQVWGRRLIKISVGYPVGDVQWAARHGDLTVKLEMWAGDTDLGFIKL